MIFGWILIFIALYFILIQRLSFWRKKRSFAGKVVVVTGGASGIGREIAIRFAKEKAVVCVWDLASQGSAMEETKRHIEQKGGRCSIFAVDVTNTAQVKELVASMEVNGTQIDVMINNAGVAYKGPLMNQSEAELERTFKVNVLAPMYACQAVIPLMAKRKSGHIVVVSSMMDSLIACYLTAYTASKWAATAFCEGLREELAEQDLPIGVTLVRPWIVDTPMFTGVPFFSHWVRYLIPPTTAVAVAEATFAAVRDGDASATVPKNMALWGYMYQLFPRSLSTRIHDLLGTRYLLHPGTKTKK